MGVEIPHQYKPLIWAGRKSASFSVPRATKS